MPEFKKILDSQRGGKILIDTDGYLYNYLRETSRGSTWACRAKYKTKCATRIYCNEEHQLTTTVQHNHPPQEGQARAIEVMRKFNCGGDSRRLSYKIRKELSLLDLDADHLTLECITAILDPKKQRSRKRGRMGVGSAADSCGDGTSQPDQSDSIVDVETNVPDISSSALDLGLNEELQEAIEQLSNEPELLQLLISRLMESQDAQGQSQDPEMMEATLIQRQRVRNALSPEIQILSPESSAPQGSNTFIPIRPVVETVEIVQDASPKPPARTRRKKQKTSAKNNKQAEPFPTSNSRQGENTDPSVRPYPVNTSTNDVTLSSTTSQSNSTTLPTNEIAPDVTIQSEHAAGTGTMVPIIAIKDRDSGLLLPPSSSSLTAVAVPAAQIHFPPAEAGSSGQNSGVCTLVTSSGSRIVSSNQMVYSAGTGVNSANQVVSKLVPLSALVLAPSPDSQRSFCHQCQKWFSDKEELDVHYNSLLCCEMCKMAFCVREHYDNHMELNHPDGKKSAWGVLCESCGRVFGVMFQLDAHRLKCCNRRSIRCSRCFYSFGFEEDLARHKQIHVDLFPFECIDCKKTWPTISGLQKHQATKRNEVTSPHTCTLCSKRVCTKREYDRHLSTHHIHTAGRGKSTPAASSGQRKSLRLRDRTIGRTAPEIIVQIPDMPVEPQDSVIHLGSDISSPTFFCTFCKEVFSSQQSLLDHEKTHLKCCNCSSKTRCNDKCSKKQQQQRPSNKRKSRKKAGNREKRTSQQKKHSTRRLMRCNSPVTIELPLRPVTNITIDDDD